MHIHIHQVYYIICIGNCIHAETVIRYSLKPISCVYTVYKIILELDGGFF